MDIEQLRKKFNKCSREEQISEYNRIFIKLNPGVKLFSGIKPVDQLTKSEYNHIRAGVLEANKLRKEGLL